VPAVRVGEIVRERRGISTDTALRLARYFNTTAKFWMNLQVAYDLAIVSETCAVQIERVVNPRGAT